MTGDQCLRWIKNIYAKYVESRVFANRLHQRLAFYSIGSRDQLPKMRVDCVYSSCEAKHSACINLIQSYAGFFSRLHRAADHTVPRSERNAMKFALTMHGIHIDQYEDFQQYKRDLSKRSSFFIRHANKAIKKGYVVERFNPTNFSVDMLGIRRSMKIRSFGVMPEAWLANIEQFGGFPQEWNEISLPSCKKHWEIFIGIFKNCPGHKQGPLIVDRRLVGYARLHRIGNMLAYKDFIGDGRFVADGVMKLLHIHIVQWVLDSRDEYAEGIENIAHGSIERGSEGIFFWKKKALFTPYCVTMVEKNLPDDFDAQLYLELNPDVRAARLGPAQHYQVHGRYEKRIYRQK